MKEFLLKAILYPFLAILFCLAFGVPFVYAGFQTVSVEDVKDDDGAATISFTRKHFFGLYQTTQYVEGVEDASFENTRVRRLRSIGNSRATVSGVFINTRAESVHLFAGSSNLDESTKWDAVKSINSFISNDALVEYSHTFRIRNIFGWFGLPFLVVGILGLLGWPSSIIRYRK